MIDERIAKQKLTRLQEMRSAPTEAGGWRLLIDALMQTADDVAHADRIIEQAYGREFCPVAKDLRGIAFETRGKALQPDPNCPKCGGVGFVSARRVYDGPNLQFKGMEYDISEKCDCYALRPKRDEYGELPTRPRIAAGDVQMRPARVLMSGGGR